MSCHSRSGVTSKSSSEPASCSRRKLAAEANAIAPVRAHITFRGPNTSPTIATSSQPHLVSRAVQEYSCSQAIGFRSRVRAVSHRKTCRQNCEFEKLRVHRGCGGSTISRCQLSLRAEATWAITIQPPANPGKKKNICSEEGWGKGNRAQPEKKKKKAADKPRREQLRPDHGARPFQ